MRCRLPLQHVSAVLCCWILLIGSTFAQDRLEETTEAAANLDTTRDWQSGWIQLFDQATPFGWRGVNPQDVQEGRLMLRAGNVVRTSAQFSEFTLHLKYRLAANSQAELLLLASPRALETGVDHMSLRLSSEQNQITVNVTTTDSSADTATSKITHWFGGFNEQANLQSQRDEVKLGRGYIGFRVSEGTLQIEQVSLLPTLPESDRYTSLEESSGFDLRGVGQARAEIFEGAIAVRGGPGYLATTQSYTDFVLSIDARAQAGTNSGVFFRCIPGDNLNGYESQIHNGTVGGDRALPEDCGTGGIFRRVNARRVVADEGQWFRKVILVCGGQISVWVNGYQVTDWSDQRPPNENPRRGRRLAAGTIMLQAHDPGTQVEFKNLRIVELSERQ